LNRGTVSGRHILRDGDLEDMRDGTRIEDLSI
jgi:hypothetical protein